LKRKSKTVVVIVMPSFLYMYVSHVDPLLGNASVNKPATNTQPTTEWTHCKARLAIHARNNKGHPLLSNGCVFCAVVRPQAM
jgi:hypothetical protein